LRGEEAEVFGDAGYQGADKRLNAKKDATWHVAMRLGKRKAGNWGQIPTKSPGRGSMTFRVELDFKRTFQKVWKA
jgi:IS5 family transposase